MKKIKRVMCAIALMLVCITPLFAGCSLNVFGNKSQLDTPEITLYNEDNSQTDTEEEDSGGGNRKITEVSTKKEVIYQEINGEKVPVTQSTIKPKIEGAIITATGAGNSEVKLRITQAVEAATGLATHKIQVFEMGDY